MFKLFSYERFIIMFNIVFALWVSQHTARELLISACCLLFFVLYVSSKVVVRIKFPDRLVLQGFFRPMEKGTYVLLHRGDKTTMMCNL